MEEAEEAPRTPPWTKPSFPTAAWRPDSRLRPGLGRSHRPEFVVGWDLRQATPASSTCKIPPQPRGRPAHIPSGQAGPKDSGPGCPLRGGVCPPPQPPLR